VAWHVQMMATKGAGADGQGMLTTYMPGLRYAADNGARISNASFTTLAPKKEDINQMYNAVDYARGKGVLFVAAAGNDAWNNDHPGKLQAFPASLDLPNVISVASNTADDQLAASSSYGQKTVDLAAPGDMVGSTYPVALSPDPTFPYSGGSGTSFAAPHVVGTAALMLARNPGLTYGQLKDLILSNVDRASAFAGTTVSGGRLNIYRALAAVAPATAGAGAASGGSVFSAALISTDRDLLATAAGGVLA
jgi:subtilisin family serine protease